MRNGKLNRGQQIQEEGGGMKQFWLKFYAFWRSLFSPFIWRIFYKRKRYINNEVSLAWYANFWVSSMESAENMLNSVGYKSDIGRGLVDASVPPKYAYTFFADLKHGRDCDDFARLWSLWGEAHDFEAREWIVTSAKKGEFFKRAHMVTTLSKYGEHYLMDYSPFGPHNVLADALGELSRRYPDGYILAEYKWRREW